MSVPTYVQSQSAQAAPAASVTTAGMTTTTGNFLVVMACRNDSVPLPASPISDLYGNTWLQAWFDWNDLGVFSSGACYYAQNITGGAGHTVTFTLASGTDGLAIAVAEFSNVSTTFALNSTAHTSDAHVGTPSATPPIVSGPLSGVTAGQLLIGCGSVSHGREFAASIGRYTDLFRASAGNQGGVIMSYAVTDTIAAYDYAYQIPVTTVISESYGLATFTGTGIAYVQQTGAASGSPFGPLTTPGITTTSGHLLVVIASNRNDDSFDASSLTDSKSNTWTLAWVNNTGTGHQNGRGACYYVENCTGGAAHTFTLSFSGSAELAALSVAEFSGVDLTSALDQVTSAHTSTKPFTTAAVTIGQAEELLIGGGTVSNGVTYGYSTIPLDWTTIEVLTLVNSSDEGVIMAYQIAPADGTYEYGASTGSVGATSFEAVGIASFEPGEPEPFVNPETSTIQIRRMRRTPHLNKDHKRITHRRFELLAQVGEGTLTGQGLDPQITLRWSDDGGRTWSREHTTSLGKMGQYATRVIWRRLGQARDRVYEITDSDPVNVALITAYLDADVGTS